MYLTLLSTGQILLQRKSLVIWKRLANSTPRLQRCETYAEARQRAAKQGRTIVLLGSLLVSLLAAAILTAVAMLS